MLFDPGVGYMAGQYTHVLDIVGVVITQVWQVKQVRRQVPLKRVWWGWPGG